MIKKIRIIGFMFVIFASYFSVSCKFDKEETEKELESKISLTVSLPNDDGDVVILTNDKAPIKLSISSTDTITKAVYKKRQNGSVPNANELITDENSTDINVDSETLIFYVFENGLYDIAVQNSKGICEYTSVEIKTIDKIPLPEVRNLTASCDGDYIYLSWKNPLPEDKYDSPLRKIRISYEYNDNKFDSTNGESFVNADEEFFSIKIADGKNKSDYIKIIIQTVDDLGNKSLGSNIKMVCNEFAYVTDLTPVLIVNDYPKTNDVVRDKFLLSGTCTGDFNPHGLIVTFKNTKQNSSLKYIFSGDDGDGIEIASDGNWSLLVDPLDLENPMIDGEYEVEFYVTDDGNHEIREKKIFTIDNTPPIVVLERPSSRAYKTQSLLDEYGQIFTLVGQLADTNDVAFIEINVYDHIPDVLVDTPVRTILLNDISERINLDAAVWKKNEDDGTLPYEDIYGSTGMEGTKNFYFTMNAYDYAVRYPVDVNGNRYEQSEADKKGNSTNGVYYLYGEILETVNKYKIKGLYDIFSNVYVSPSENNMNANNPDFKTIEFVKNELKEYEVKCGGFSLNPENNPTFSVIGMVPLDERGDDFASTNNEHILLNGTSVTIEISPGLDSIPLIPVDVWEKYDPETDKIKVYVQECDNYGMIKSDVPKIYPLSISKRKNGSSYRFSVNIKNGNNKVCKIINAGQDNEYVEWMDATLNFGANYRIGVEGEDLKNNRIMEALDAKGLRTLYGFKFASNGTAPILEITYPVDNLIYLPKNSNLTINGSIMTEDSSSVLAIYNGNEKIYERKIRKEECEIAKINGNNFFRFNFDISLSETNFNQDISEQYAIKIVADNGNKTEVIKTVVYDVDAPEICILAERPLASGSFKINTGEILERNDFINDVFTVRGTVIDDYDRVEITKWEFFQNNKVVDSGIIEANNFILAIDTKRRAYEDNAEGKLVITSKDRAGNEVSIERTYYICQETDYPIIKSRDPETLSFDFTSKNQLKAELLKGNTINTKSEGQQLQFMFADDDGIDSIMISTISANGFDSYGQLQIRGDGRTEYAYIYTVPTIPGYYYVTISLTDINGERNMFGYNDTVCILVTGREYKINLSASPEWITTLEDENSRENAKTQFTILGENIGDSAFQTVLVDDENDEIGVHTITNPDKDGYITWIDLFKPDPYIFNEEKIYQEEVVYYAIGKTTGQRSLAALFRYKIDNVKPLLFNITPPNVEETMFSSFRISGFASDEGSGLSTIEVIAKNKDEGLNDNDVWQQATIGGDGSWFYTLVFSEFPSVFGQNGEKTLYARAYDVVGNCSIIYSGDFIYDSAEPEITIEKYIEKQTGIAQLIPDNGCFSMHQTFSLTGNAFDLYGVKDIKIEQIESNGTRTLIKSILGSELTTEGKWTVENLPRKSDGTPQESIRLGKYTYYLTVTDLVGKTSSTGVSVTIDSVSDN